MQQVFFFQCSVTGPEAMGSGHKLNIKKCFFFFNFEGGRPQAQVLQRGCGVSHLMVNQKLSGHGLGQPVLSGRGPGLTVHLSALSIL